jgi:DNA repair protein RadA/Sms
MAKVKKTFVCQNCGARTSKWLRQCSSCGEWNTIVEEIIQEKTIQSPGLTIPPKTSTTKPEAIQ